MVIIITGIILIIWVIFAYIIINPITKLSNIIQKKVGGYFNLLIIFDCSQVLLIILLYLLYQYTK